MARTRLEGVAGLAIIGHFPKRERTVTLELPAVTPEYDFTTGAFWQTPIGQNLGEFAEQNLLKESFPLPATTVSSLLKLTNDKQQQNVVSELVKSKILRYVQPGRTGGHVLTLPQTLICDLVLHTLEQGHSVSETVDIVSRAVEGTFLEDFLNRSVQSIQNVHSGDTFFSKNSHWKKLASQDIPLSGRIFDSSEVGKIDFEKGDFWKTQLGKAIRDLVESQRILEGLPSSLTASRIAMELVSNSQQKTLSSIIVMTQRGLLVHPDREELHKERSPSLAIPHLLISGLILSSLDHGESLASVSVRLENLLKGTSLEPYMRSVNAGEHDDKYPFKTRGNTHLEKKSPWSNLFLPKEDQQTADIVPFDRVDNNEEEPGWVYAGYRPIPGKSLEIDIGVLNKSGRYNAQELAMLRMEFSKHNADTDSINVNRLHGFPSELLNILAFVSAAVNRKLMLYETLLEDFTNYDFKMSLLACEQLMTSCGANSLKDMFKILMEEIEKDPISYWNAEQAR